MNSNTGWVGVPPTRTLMATGTDSHLGGCFSRTNFTMGEGTSHHHARCYRHINPIVARSAGRLSYRIGKFIISAAMVA